MPSDQEQASQSSSGIEMMNALSSPSSFQDEPASVMSMDDAEFGIAEANAARANRRRNKWPICVAVVCVAIVIIASGRVQSPFGVANAGDGDLPVYPYPFDKPRMDLPWDYQRWTPRGGNRYTEYKEGTSPYRITDKIQRKSDQLARQRRKHVKEAFEHAWTGYTTYAFGMDELKPVSKQGDNVWEGLATTMVDALDTLWLMGFEDEFWECRDFVRDTLDYDKNVSVLIFETNIRSLGGLLSAHAWSGDEVFLDKALDMAKRMARSFDDAPTAIPYGRVNLMTGESYNDNFEPFVPTSQVGTLQLEFRWLDEMVGSKETADMRNKTEAIVAALHQLNPDYGLYPTLVKNVGVTEPEFANNHLSFGANGDSFYEYVLKAWIQGGQEETVYRGIYNKAIQGMHDRMVQKSTPSGLTYLVDLVDDQPVHKLHHLTCFMGALLAIGAYTDPLGFDSERAERDLKTSKALAYTCYQMYARQETGLSPEEVEFVPGRDFQLEGQADVRPEGDLSEYGTQPGSYTTTSQNIMRPEVVETFFTLHAITGDPIYREWGWEVFLAIETYLKTEIAYGEYPDVSDVNAKPNDKMESFFLAETLKYLYLLFDPDTEVDILNKHVFNTEGHPLPVFRWLED